MTDWLCHVLIDADIGFEILIPMLDIRSRIALSSVSVNARAALCRTYNKYKTMLNNFGHGGVCRAAAECGDIDTVTRCVVDLGCFCNYPSLSLVILPGCMELVKFLHNQPVERHRAMKLRLPAVKHNQLDCLEFVLQSMPFAKAQPPTSESEIKLTAQCMKKAAGYGHTKCLQCLYKYRDRQYGLDSLSKEAHSEAFFHALRSGQLSCVKLMVDQGFDERTQAFTDLAFVQNSGSECLHFLREQGWPWPPTREMFLELAAANGALECLRYTRHIFAPWNSRIAVFAAFNGHLEVLKFLIEDGSAWHSDLLNVCIDYCQTEVFEWAVMNGCPVSVPSLRAHLASIDINTCIPPRLKQKQEMVQFAETVKKKKK